MADSAAKKWRLLRFNYRSKSSADIGSNCDRMVPNLPRRETVSSVVGEEVKRKFSREGTEGAPLLQSLFSMEEPAGHGLAQCLNFISCGINIISFLDPRVIVLDQCVATVTTTDSTVQ